MLTIVATITARKEQLELVKAELTRLIEPTRAEAGCIQYDLHQDNDHPEVFLFYENWESRELWQAHMDSDHLRQYLAATEGAVAEFSLREMQRL